MQMASDCVFGAWWLPKAFFWQFGALLETFGAKKKWSWTPPGRSKRNLKTGFIQKEVQKAGHKNSLRAPLFAVPKWGPKMDPPFDGFPRAFRGFPRTFFGGFQEHFELTKWYKNGLQIKVWSYSFRSWSPVQPTRTSQKGWPFGETSKIDERLTKFFDL